MVYYAVIDTNVLVSALLSKHDDSATVLLIKKMIDGGLTPVYSDEIMKEYQEVLSRKKFGFDLSKIELILSSIRFFGLAIKPSPIGVTLPDLKDLPFYEVVMEKRNETDAYLVTGNQKHFPTQPFIVTPKEMLDILKVNL